MLKRKVIRQVWFIALNHVLETSGAAQPYDRTARLPHYCLEAISKPCTTG